MVFTNYHQMEKLHLVTSSMSLPNGIALSNDEKFVYVNNAGNLDPKIMRFNLSSLMENFSLMEKN